MGRILVKEEDFSEIVDIYNSKGKTAAYDMLRNKYGSHNPYFVITRIKKSKDYTYDPENDRFTSRSDPSAEGVFMDLEELCSPAVTTVSPARPSVTDRRPAAMEKLIHELISDRLLALSRYISVDSAARTIYIDQTSLTADGYQVITH